MSLEICSKCKVSPAAKNHLWCVECKAQNQANNRSAQLRQARAGGFRDGALAMQSHLIGIFHRLGAVQVTCATVARAIGDEPPPQIQT